MHDEQSLPRRNANQKFVYCTYRRNSYHALGDILNVIKNYRWDDCRTCYRTTQGGPPKPKKKPSYEQVLFDAQLRREVGTRFMHGTHQDRIPSVKVPPSRAPGREGRAFLHACALDGGLEWLIYRIYFQSVLGSTHTHKTDNRYKIEKK